MRKIDHFVVLMLENRSFDHIFGFRQGVHGLSGNESNLLSPSEPESDANPSFKVDSNAPFAVLAGYGPGHSLNATNYQLVNDKTGPSADLPSANNGFVRNYRDELAHDRTPNPDSKTMQVVMQSFSAGSLPSINALADAFAVCDNWISEVPGPTQPNRFDMHAATSAVFALNNWKRVLDVRTIYNALEDAGFSWATYAFDSNEVLEFSQVSGKTQNFKLFENSFKTDVTAGTLANYSFIIPRFFNSKNAAAPTGGLANSQHAPQDARYGDNLVADVYEALRGNPDIWAKSALIVNYDEHGGFYDHFAAPSPVPNPDALTSPAEGDPSYAPTFAFDRLGLRVPAVIASPWIKERRVDSTRYQHTSVLATLKLKFGLGEFLTKRDASANSFQTCSTSWTSRVSTHRLRCRARHCHRSLCQRAILSIPRTNHWIPTSVTS
ncbi:alkaline phosphatase family protein [Paraburkholderia sediminicola]|uniref:alkaline phosphatase family protein n=1 Tax=Paraburkholderia sediminicola TaxID=458836 RepID=UPI0038BD4082